MRYRDGRDVQHIVYWYEQNQLITFCDEIIYPEEPIALLSTGTPTCVRCIACEGKERPMPL
jgi:hypothetical protein